MGAAAQPWAEETGFSLSICKVGLLQPCRAAEMTGQHRITAPEILLPIVCASLVTGGLGGPECVTSTKQVVGLEPGSWPCAHWTHQRVGGKPPRPEPWRWGSEHPDIRAVLVGSCVWLRLRDSLIPKLDPRDQLCSADEAPSLGISRSHWDGQGWLWLCWGSKR